MNAIHVGALAALVALAPLAGASHGFVEDVLAPTEQPLAQASAGGFYVFADAEGVEVWRETNGCQGLQKSEGMACGSYRPSDTKILALP